MAAAVLGWRRSRGIGFRRGASMRRAIIAVRSGQRRIRPDGTHRHHGSQSHHAEVRAQHLDRAAIERGGGEGV